MTINTKYFGELEITEKDTINFPDGIYGFEDQTSFVIIRFGEDEEGDLYCLQSVSEDELAFVLMNPFLIYPGYDPEPSADDLKELSISDGTPVSFFSIVVVKDSMDDSTVNLRCPILINNQANIAKQIVLENNGYSMRACISPVREGS